MKKRILTLIISTFICGALFAQRAYRQSVSILGDSYSTFEGYITPESNLTWYFLDHRQKENDVIAVEQTWWHQLLKKNGWKLCMNNSYSGSTISSSGYGKADYSDRSFVTRANNLGNPDMIFIFGATNDSWVPSPIGEYKYSGWTKEDLKDFRPSLARLLDYMQKRYVGVKLYFILNSELSDAITASVFTICDRYGVPVIALHDIEKKAGHPSIAGMKAIADQVDAYVHTRQGKVVSADRKPAKHKNGAHAKKGNDAKKEGKKQSSKK